jgi:hypothetical protein
MPMNKQPVTKAEDQIAESVATAQESQEKFVASTTKKIDLAALNDYCNHFTIAVLLAELRNRDPQRADELILWINQALEDGDTAGESVWQWHDQIQRGHAPTGVGPYKDGQPAVPADAKPFTVKTSDGPFDVLAVHSDTPGLVIAQEIRTGVNGTNVVATGRWTVNHAGSGLLATPTPYGVRPSWPFDVARRIAAELGGLGVDWALSKEDFARVREATPDLGLKVIEIVRTGEGCQYCTDADHAVPAWRAMPSTEAGAA